MAVFDSAYTPGNIKPKVTRYSNGNIAIMSEGVVIAFWNEAKGKGEIAGSAFYYEPR